MTEQIEKAAIWLAEQRETPQQVIHLLRRSSASALCRRLRLARWQTSIAGIERRSGEQ